MSTTKNKSKKLFFPLEMSRRGLLLSLSLSLSLSLKI
jgi:hypothetical protein